MVQDKTNNSIDYLNIDSDSNYFSTKEQVKIQSVQWFEETTEAFQISGSNHVSGLFSRKRIIKDDTVYNSSIYLTGSSAIDSSGKFRKILASTNDYFSSSSLDSYRNGVEITQEKHWTSGLVKISAGTPGHLYHSTLFGIPITSIISKDIFFEIDTFNPISYIDSGGDPTLFTYPIITSDVNQIENTILNGIIEPFPIRPIISNFSINFPFEPQGTRGSLQSGNENERFSTDRVVNLDVFHPNSQNKTWYLDATFQAQINTGSASVGSLGSFGESLGYSNLNENFILPFIDFVPPRGIPVTSSYGNDLIEVVKLMPPGGTTYIENDKKSFTCGFVYDGAYQGTDSIAYGGLLY